MAHYEVDIDLANQAKKEMAAILDTDNRQLLNGVGAFSSLYHWISAGIRTLSWY